MQVATYFVAGTTGNTGSVVVDELLKAGHKVRTLVRKPEHADKLKAKGVEVHIGDLSDAKALTTALQGVQGAYVLVAGAGNAPDDSDRRAIVTSIVSSVKAADLAHVVVLSSVGAHHATGTGPIAMLHELESGLDTTGINRTYVRASFFLENWGGSLGAVKGQGVLPTFVPAAMPYAMVSTVDIGRTAARALLQPASGRRVIELEGPARANAHDVAHMLSAILKKPINVVEAPLAGVAPTLTSFGMSAHMAGHYHEMYSGIINGVVGFEGGHEHVRGETALIDGLRRFAG